MSYTIDERYSDSEFTAAANVPGTFGGTPRRIESITIHHWGVFGQTHDGVVNFFLNQSFTTSAHFVVSAGRINCLVSPANAAWAAGNAYGNATSIHIECRPEASEEDYKTVAWLVDWLRDHYGKTLPLIPHRNWQSTACPGIWDLAKVDRLAKAIDATAKPAPAKPAPAPAKPAPMKPRVFPDSDLHWVVSKGDTLNKIQKYYNGPTVAQIAAYNNINPNQIKPGQKIWIPGPLVWVIEAPDTIRSVAKYYGLDPAYLARLNGLSGPDATIYIGNRLTIKK
jgi:N-acetylmuramoyl-L-alanine amidase